MMPLGFKFRPTDVELLHYLTQKIKFGYCFENLFLEEDVYGYNPQGLIARHRRLEENQEAWYFFTSRCRKYENGRRPDRKAGDGYWKAVAKDQEIIDQNGVVIGYKKVLDFYAGKQTRGTKTEWKMLEYLLKDQKDNPQNPSQGSKKLNECILCKIYTNKRIKKRKLEDISVEDHDTVHHAQVRTTLQHKLPAGMPTTQNNNPQNQNCDLYPECSKEELDVYLDYYGVVLEDEKNPIEFGQTDGDFDQISDQKFEDDDDFDQILKSFQSADGSMDYQVIQPIFS